MTDTTRRKRNPNQDDGTMTMKMLNGGIDEETTTTTTTSYVAAGSNNDVASSGVMNDHHQHQHRVEESHTRSLVKGLTWRFIASFTTIVIAKIVTGETADAFKIGFFEFFAKLAIYYIHERIWAKIRI
mmetsp:Transcript_31943/g.77684  ORF Transcript_31943/g.77684 Transcript_31943/m.77684 type:complete len:128 (-) Transcript_31943:1272-1655(-)